MKQQPDAVGCMPPDSGRQRPSGATPIRATTSSCVALDARGTDPVLARPRLAFCVRASSWIGPTTRNRAAARGDAPLLLNADSDDVPTEAALDALAPAFAERTVGLVFGDWLERWPDREPWTPVPRFRPGRLEPGTLSEIWGAKRWVPLHLACAMWRTDAVLAAGGWSATVGGSDIGLMLGVDGRWASVYVPQRTFTYYHHAAQATASRDWQAQFARDTEFLERRRRALHAVRRTGRPG